MSNPTDTELMAVVREALKDWSEDKLSAEACLWAILLIASRKEPTVADTAWALQVIRERKIS